MKARIVYDADGTQEITVEADWISTQLWDNGRAKVALVNGLENKETRVLHFTRVYMIDKDKG